MKNLIEWHRGSDEKWVGIHGEWMFRVYSMESGKGYYLNIYRDYTGYNGYQGYFDTGFHVESPTLKAIKETCEDFIRRIEDN